MNAIFPGSFDPITLGHLDLIRRAASICDILTIAILINPEKTGDFPLNERLDMVKSACEGLSNVRVVSFSGLLVDLARELDTRIIIRGVRGGHDLDGEMAMAWANAAMHPGLETLFLPAANGLGGVSSSLVRQIARFNGNISPFVPEKAVNGVLAHYHNEDKSNH
jgi:pantetheine-phosphate adenylyltransferase